MKLRVALNGTDSNPWHRMGFRCNPIPQLARYEYDAACLRLQELGGDPIPHASAEAYIREKLNGFSKEFVDLCVQQFKPGELVMFEVHFPER